MSETRKMLKEFADMFSDIENSIYEAKLLAAIEEFYTLQIENERLRDEHRGPEGFVTWKDAAIHERMERVSLQAEITRLRTIEAAAREYVTDSYRPEPKYDAQRFDALCAALEYRDE